MQEDFLFVYGTLRPGCDDPMAAWLMACARHVGPASTGGALYAIADYPGFVPGADGQVAGDLFALPDLDRLFAILDAHEECSDAFAQPHEYRRERVMVQTPGGSVAAWTYIYAHDVTALARVRGGDFLA